MSNIKTILLVAAILSVGGVGSFVIYRLYKKQVTREGVESTDQQKDEREDEAEEEEFYGTSTYGKCSGCSCGCVVSGCNGEICQSEEEESMGSICVIPNKPTPDELGYSCQCIDNQCQWAK